MALAEIFYYHECWTATVVCIYSYYALRCGLGFFSFEGTNVRLIEVLLSNPRRHLLVEYHNHILLSF